MNADFIIGILAGLSVGLLLYPVFAYRQKEPLEPLEKLVRETISVSELGPNDIIVLRVPAVIEDDTAARLKGELSEYFDKRKILVLGNGLNLEFISPGPPLWTEAADSGTSRV